MSDEDITEGEDIEGSCIGCGKYRLIDPDTSLCDDCTYEPDVDDGFDSKE